MESLKSLMATLPPLPPIRKTQPEPTAYYLEMKKKLLEICQKGDLPALGELMDVSTHKEPIDLNLLLNEPTGVHQWSPLMVAVYYGHKNIVKYLIVPQASLEDHRYKIDLHYQTPSGATVFDFVNQHKQRELKSKLTSNEAVEKDTKELYDLLHKETERKKRLDKNETKRGFHETSRESFKYILQDILKGRYSMVGGDGGYFGGGIYFAASKKEANKKALHHGNGFECNLKMGNCLKITTQDQLKNFKKQYCDNRPYQTPVDVMQERLLEDNYDSVWGHQDINIKTLSNRVLQTGDEYVVYSADQVEILHTFNINRNTNTWIQEELNSLLETLKRTEAFSKNFKHLYEINAFNHSYSTFAPKNQLIAFIHYTNVFIWDLKLQKKNIAAKRKTIAKNEKIKEEEVNVFPTTITGKDYSYNITLRQIITAIAFSPDEKQIAIACLSNGQPSLKIIKLLKNQTFEIQQDIFHKEEATIYQLAYTPDGNYVISGDKQGNCVFWPITDPTDSKDPKDPTDPTRSINMQQKGIIAMDIGEKTFAFADQTNTIYIMPYSPTSISKNTELLTIPPSLTSHSFYLVKMCEKRDLLVYTTVDGEIGLIKISTGQLIHKWTNQEGSLTKCVFSPSGNYLIVGAENNTMFYIWDISNVLKPFLFYEFSFFYEEDDYKPYNELLLLEYTADEKELLIQLKQNGSLRGFPTKGFV